MRLKLNSKVMMGMLGAVAAVIVAGCDTSSNGGYKQMGDTGNRDRLQHQDAMSGGGEQTDMISPQVIDQSATDSDANMNSGEADRMMPAHRVDEGKMAGGENAAMQKQNMQRGQQQTGQMQAEQQQAGHAMQQNNMQHQNRMGQQQGEMQTNGMQQGNMMGQEQRPLQQGQQERGMSQGRMIQNEQNVMGRQEGSMNQRDMGMQQSGEMHQRNMMQGDRPLPGQKMNNEGVAGQQQMNGSNQNAAVMEGNDQKPIDREGTMGEDRGVNEGDTAKQGEINGSMNSSDVPVRDEQGKQDVERGEAGEMGNESRSNAMPDKKEPTTLVSVVGDERNLSTLGVAIREAGLSDALEGAGPFTLFAPTDEAFSALPEGVLSKLLKPVNRVTLQTILRYHVVQGDYRAEQVIGMTQMHTLEGQAIKVSVKDGHAFVDGAKVLRTNLDAGNGVVHEINKVLIPDGLNLDDLK